MPYWGANSIANSGGTTPDHRITSPFVPVVIVGDRHVRCCCIWGSFRQGEMYLRFYNAACEVKKRGGHS
jgi:hypothetical protein